MQQFTAKVEDTIKLKENLLQSKLANSLLTFHFLWAIYYNSDKGVGRMLFGIFFNFADVFSQTGLLMTSNWVSEENALTYAMHSQSRPLL